MRTPHPHPLLCCTGVASAPGIEHAVSGLLLDKELRFLSGAVLDSPKRPLVSIVGGSKVCVLTLTLTLAPTKCGSCPLLACQTWQVSTKMPVLHSLSSTCQRWQPPVPSTCLIWQVSTKMPVLHSLLESSDALMIGGAMAFTFVKASLSLYIYIRVHMHAYMPTCMPPYVPPACMHRRRAAAPSASLSSRTSRWSLQQVW